MDVFHGNLPFGREKRPKIQDINHIIMGQFALKIWNQRKPNTTKISAHVSNNLIVPSISN